MQYLVSYCTKGIGTKKDPKKAFNCYEISAKSTARYIRIWGQYKLGLCYLDGFGVDVDLAKAKELLTLSNLAVAERALSENNL